MEKMFELSQILNEEVSTELSCTPVKDTFRKREHLWSQRWSQGGPGSCRARTLTLGAELQLLTDSGALSSTDVDPEAEAVRAPGMVMGSGETARLLRTAGASGLPQFFQSNPLI